jgi:hypothetical protein
MSDDPHGDRAHSHERRATRDMIVALAVKACLLAAIYTLFFAPSRRPADDAGSTAAALLAAPIHGASK